MTFIASCGCVFCDLDLPAIPHEDGKRMLHRYKVGRRERLIECTKIAEIADKLDG